MSDAIKEAYAGTTFDSVVLNTLTIEHPKIYPLYLVKDGQDHLFTLETGQKVRFISSGFQFTLPTQGDDGISELNIAVDNVGIAVADFISAITGSQDKITVTYRPYIEGRPDSPEVDPPYVFTLTDIMVSEDSVQGRATLRDMVNRKFPSSYYTRSRFPSLGD